MSGKRKPNNEKNDDKDAVFVRHERKTTQKSGFEVKKTGDEYVLSAVPKNCYRIQEGYKVKGISGIKVDNFQDEDDANRILESISFRVIPRDKLPDQHNNNNNNKKPKTRSIKIHLGDPPTSKRRSKNSKKREEPNATTTATTTNQQRNNTNIIVEDVTEKSEGEDEYETYAVSDRNLKTRNQKEESENEDDEYSSAGKNQNRYEDSDEQEEEKEYFSSEEEYDEDEEEDDYEDDEEEDDYEDDEDEDEDGEDSYDEDTGSQSISTKSFEGESYDVDGVTLSSDKKSKSDKNWNQEESERWKEEQDLAEKTNCHCIIQ